MPSHVSPEAQDLIRKLLRTNPKDRLSLAAVIEHPFLTPPSVSKKWLFDSSVDSGRGTSDTLSPPSVSRAAMSTQTGGRTTRLAKSTPKLPTLQSGHEKNFSPAVSKGSRGSNLDSGMELNTSARLEHPYAQHYLENVDHWLKRSEKDSSVAVSGVMQLASRSLSSEGGGGRPAVSSPVESNSSQTIESVISPLKAHRLKPFRQKAKNAVMNILPEGDVCLEFFKMKGQREELIDVLRISPDGLKITIYQPRSSRAVVNMEPPPMPEDPRHRLEYAYANLPQKYWRKYQYAARFIKMVRSRTPKIIIHSKDAKCILMENSPVPNFEVDFANGAHCYIEGERTRIVEPSGATFSIESNSSCQHLSTQTQKMVEFVRTTHQMCLDIEEMHSKYEEVHPAIAQFPIRIGRDLNLPPKAESSRVNKLGDSHFSSTIISNPPLKSFEGTLVSVSSSKPKEDSDLLPVRESASNSLADTVVKKVFVPSVGWASQMESGTIAVQFNDGAELQLSADASKIQLTDSLGRKWDYDKQLPVTSVPDIFKEKLKALQLVIDRLARA